MPHRLPVDLAARELGLSVATVKRRLKRGTLRGEQESTPSGFRWLVLVDDAAPPAAAAVGVAGVAEVPPPATASAVAGVAGVAVGVAGATAGTALLSQRAEEMARYSAELLRPYVATIERQAEELGALRAQLAAATTSAPPAGRSWWQRRVWG